MLDKEIIQLGNLTEVKISLVGKAVINFDIEEQDKDIFITDKPPFFTHQSGTILIEKKQKNIWAISHIPYY